jgi:hypothetical protein
MRKTDAPVPAALRNGTDAPTSFDAIRDALLPRFPRYKIVVFSIDSYASFWRVVHFYGICVVTTDPSNVTRFMAARGITPGKAYDDHGHALPDLVAFSERLPLSKMLEFNGLISDLIKDNSTHYLMKSGHNLVQYIPERFREPVVMTSISRR